MSDTQEPLAGDSDEKITMTFTREEWGRIYNALRARRDEWSKETEWETWKAHEKLRLDMLEQL